MIIDKHNGGPVGVETIAASIAEDIGTLEEVVEPYLLQLGFLKRTKSGRVATKSAYEHLSKKLPKQTDQITGTEIFCGRAQRMFRSAVTPS